MQTVPADTVGRGVAPAADSLGPMFRHLLVIVACAIVATACSSGPTAPPVGAGRQVCTDAFCLEVPDGWDGEVGETHIALHHEVLPEGTFLTANVVDLEAIVTAAGGEWPVGIDGVVTAFWALLEDAEEGSFTRMERMVGGAYRSWGSHSTGDMWHVIVPVRGTVGIGVEVRGPNDSWESHADFVFPSVVPASSDDA